MSGLHQDLLVRGLGIVHQQPYLPVGVGVAGGGALAGQRGPDDALGLAAVALAVRLHVQVQAVQHPLLAVACFPVSGNGVGLPYLQV